MMQGFHGNNAAQFMTRLVEDDEGKWISINAIYLMIWKMQ